MTVNRVLFDPPGPRARRRIAITTAVSVLVIAGLFALALRQFDNHGQLAADRWQPFTHWPYIHFLLQGVEGTLKATVTAAVISFPLGALMALLRISPNRAVRSIATVYVELFRSIPLLLLIYAFLLALPTYGINLPIFFKLVVPIVLVNVAVLAEVFRAGIAAVDRGQFEAAAAIGLRYRQVMRIVVLPQAIRIVVPALVTQLVSLLKDSTLGYVVSYPELMRKAENLTVYTHLLVQTYLIVSVIYVLMNFALGRLASVLERRLNGRPRGKAVVADPAGPAATRSAALLH
ncbi:MAG: amino acid ABC transporter permease [Actinomycetota bacterium]|nr:amino acid ABC transporter permease [Actinomycetota bacterium]MDQ2848045.1 amino acid ABC transporter permease [Actinomycetota bacterium]MDQ2957617.1 amino acid ABC transporter permease [Actinomycetota bacterium]